MTTTCESCDNVTVETRKRSPTQWTCIKHRRLPGGSFVAPDVWSEQEPYLKCSNVNGGACPFWTPVRNGQTDMKLECQE